MHFNIKDMKLNFVNKAYLVCLFGLLAATIYKTCKYNASERYYYFSSISAPETFPVYVRDAYFITHDPDDDAWFNQTDVNGFNTGWGTEYFFPEIDRPMRLPTKLVLEYASYRDRKFYSDTLDLPQETIKSVFETADTNKSMDEIRGRDGDKQGLRFVLGIANAGNIILWLRGIGLEKVILKTKLTAKEPQGDATRYETVLTKEAYLERVFGALDDSLKRALDKGLDAHASYIDSASHYLERSKYR
jgi:hypothetical protein